MPEGKVEFDVIATVEQVWSFLSDLRKVGRCVPAVENVELLDEKRARWDLKVKYRYDLPEDSSDDGDARAGLPPARSVPRRSR